MPQPEIVRRPRPHAAARQLRVTSSAFFGGGLIPRQHAADGQDQSPPLLWSEAPPDTASFVLVCDDPDSSSGAFLHWLVWNMKGDRRALEEGVPKLAKTSEFHQGQNDFGSTGYGGPHPPLGRPHHYVFHLYALDIRLDLPTAPSRAEVKRAMSDHVIAEGRLTGIYERKDA